MAVGSTGAVGSWFCSSCANRLRNVVPNELAPVPFDVELLVPVVPDVLAFVAAAFAELAAGRRALSTVGIV